MIKCDNGTISLFKTRELTEKQKNNLKIMAPANQQRYLASLLGITKEHISIPRIKAYGNDTLRAKPKGAILTQMMRLKNTSLNHVPTNADIGEWIGVEIECIVPYDTVRDHFNRDVHDNDAFTFLKSKIKDSGVSRVTVKYDGSVNDNENDESNFGLEVTIVFNSKHGFEPLEKLCAALRAADCYVNKTCGLHVHLDARHLKRVDVKRIGRRLGHALPMIKWLVPESRHRNQYCQLGVSKITTGSRYYAVNLTAFEKYKTIEVRLHGGTTDFNKIFNWIELIKLISKNENILAPMSTFQDLLDVGLSDRLVTYIETRVTDLHGDKIWSRLSPVPVPVDAAVVSPSVDNTTAVINGLAALTGAA